MHRLSATFACLFVLLLPVQIAAGAGAAATPSKDAGGVAKPAAPEVIGAAEIPLRSDIDERYVQEVIARARQPDPSTKLARRLDEMATGIKKLSETFKRDELLSLPAMRLESLERHWNFYDQQLADWRAELQRGTARYSEDAAELAKRRAAWEATRTAAAAGGLTPALAERVDSMLAEIDDAEQALSVPLDNQFRLARRGNSVQQAVDAGKKAVQAAIKNFDHRLGVIDAPPIWEAWRGAGASGQELSTALVGLGIETQFLKEYNARYANSLQLLTAAALLLLPLLIWLSRRSRKVVASDPELASSARVLLRPISSWFVLVLVGILFLEPNAPIIRHEAALLLALIPVLRLLPSKVYEVLGSWPYVVTGLYLLGQVAFLFVGVPLLHRLHLLLIGVLTLGAIAWMLARRKGRAAVAVPPRQLAFIRAAAWLALAGLVIALGANVVGNVSLAEALTGGILDTAYVGLAFYAGATVLNAILKLLLARRGMTRFRVVTRHTGPLLQSLARLVNVGAFAAWVLVVLHEFRVYRPVQRWAVAVLSYPLEAGEISITLGSVLMFLAAVWLAVWLARTIRVVLRDEVMPKMDLPRGVANSVSTLTYYGIVTVGVMVALAAAGFHISQLAFIIGALGVGIGFGLQNVVNNFVSGLILMFERPIQPGDVVEVGTTSGKVSNIGMRATTLSTFEGADVVVPNGMLLNDKLINWTLSNTDRRLDVNLGVAYGSDPRQVLELLMKVVTTTPGIATIPEPTVLFAGFGASSLDFSIRAWTNNFGDWVKIRSELAIRVYDALKAAGIEIPFPQQDLHLRSVSDAARGQLAGVGGAPPGAGSAG
ncbi:MAG: mechanosensitive ion channel [Steroidobacteraceae bacterium]